MNIFDADGKLAHGLSRIFELIKLNLLCLLMCLPIITIGASVTAAYYYLMKMVRNEESYLWKSYWKAFRENFRQSTIIWLLLLAGFSIVRIDMTIVQNSGESFMILRFALIFMLVMLVLISLYVFPVQAKFKNSIKNTFKNAFLMEIRHLPYTLLILFFFLAAPVLCILNLDLFPYYLLYVVLIGITGPAFFSAILLDKIFKCYIAEKLEESDVGVEG